MSGYGYIPHTDEEIAAMLDFVGISTVDELFAAVPESVRLARSLDMPRGCSEADVVAFMEDIGARNRAPRDLVCFAGGGAYDHEIPAAVRAVASRSEFVTAYTPYQPEVSQGVLQALFEYQTMISRLSGLPVTNASLYDGASALVEAVNLACASTGRSTLWLSQGVHPHWRCAVSTFARGTRHDIVTMPLRGGVTDWSPPAETGAPPRSAPAAVVVAYPNYLGCLDDVASAREVAIEHGALLVVCYDPVSVALVRSPGEWGADVAVAEGQVFGTPLSFGGPYLGLFSCASEHVRRLPGRLVGETVDTEGRRAYVTTLRAREQDIRREKASSNVCTNQTLMAVTAAVHLGWLGTNGLTELARRCAQGARYCFEQLVSIEGVEPLAGAPFVREFALRLPGHAETVIERLADEGFLAGIALDESYADGDDGLLVAVTEKRTRSEIDAFATAFSKAVR